MCGIFAVFNLPYQAKSFQQRAEKLSAKQRHRGPDCHGMVVVENHLLAHERLSIVGIDSGAQPLEDQDSTIVLTVNGEIYNHELLKKELDPSVVFLTHSDCEVILHLYKAIGDDVVKKLDGIFSFALLDKVKQRFIVARDPIGVTTLYYGKRHDQPGTLYFASEMKALFEDCDVIEAFPPGHIFDSTSQAFTPYYLPRWWNPKQYISETVDYQSLRSSLEAAVRKRLMAEVPYGVLLSGGLDSSLIASIVCRQVQDPASIRSFSIGLKGAPDLVAAKEVAKFLGTEHHEFNFTIEEGLDALRKVIYHLETFDVTTIRASTPMFLLSKRIHELGVKMVLSGEGSDEIFGGYLYFHAAPSAEEFHEETVQRVRNLHTSDCLRANKSTMAYSLEARVPFLDLDFLDVAMCTDAQEKMFKAGKMEKHILRQAFNDTDRPFLPHHILWRQKEQFSDGVGYSWIDRLRQHTEESVSEEEWLGRHERWPINTPQTREAYWYRNAFEEQFPGDKCARTVVRWIPRSDWGCPTDPSGRAQKVHTAAYLN